MSTPSSVLLTEKQAAERLNLSHRTLQRWRVTGQGPRYTKLGAAVRYPEDEIARFQTDGLRCSTSQMRT